MKVMQQSQMLDLQRENLFDVFWIKVRKRVLKTQKSLIFVYIQVLKKDDYHCRRSNMQQKGGCPREKVFEFWRELKKEQMFIYLIAALHK